jgi:hypothetical protein
MLTWDNISDTDFMGGVKFFLFESTKDAQPIIV